MYDRGLVQGWHEVFTLCIAPLIWLQMDHPRQMIVEYYTNYNACIVYCVLEMLCLSLLGRVGLRVRTRLQQTFRIQNPINIITKKSLSMVFL